MWDFGILNPRNNKPSEQWTPISDEWPFGTMNLYFGTMNLLNSEPSEERTPISDKWPFGPINLRHNKPFFRKNEPSEQWTFGTINLRKNGPSEKRTVTIRLLRPPLATGLYYMSVQYLLVCTQNIGAWENTGSSNLRTPWIIISGKFNFRKGMLYIFNLHVFIPMIKKLN